MSSFHHSITHTNEFCKWKIWKDIFDAVSNFNNCCINVFKISKWKGKQASTFTRFRQDSYRLLPFDSKRRGQHCLNSWSKYRFRYIMTCPSSYVTIIQLTASRNSFILRIPRHFFFFDLVVRSRFLAVIYFKCNNIET